MEFGGLLELAAKGQISDLSLKSSDMLIDQEFKFIVEMEKTEQLASLKLARIDPAVNNIQTSSTMLLRTETGHYLKRERPASAIGVHFQAIASLPGCSLDATIRIAADLFLEFKVGVNAELPATTKSRVEHAI